MEEEGEIDNLDAGALLSMCARSLFASCCITYVRDRIRLGWGQRALFRCRRKPFPVASFLLCVMQRATIASRMLLPSWSL